MAVGPLREPLGVLAGSPTPSFRSCTR
jgi:hypothetical protein